MSLEEFTIKTLRYPLMERFGVDLLHHVPAAGSLTCCWLILDTCVNYDQIWYSDMF